MIDFVYPAAQLRDPNLMQDPAYMSERCCLTPLNENSHEINDLILQQLPTPVHTYFSTDRVLTDTPEEAAAYPIEFLNAQTPSGLPKHKLELKVDSLYYQFIICFAIFSAFLFLRHVFFLQFHHVSPSYE